VLKEIFYGLLIGALILGIAELINLSKHECIKSEKKVSITDGCDSWKKRVTCYNGNEWDFKYDKSSL